MALNMYYKNGIVRKTRYQISDELIPVLYQIHNNTNFPQLNELMESLYDSQDIAPDTAQLLADEMVAFERLLLSLHLPFPMRPLQKMQTFFTEAASKQQVIYTSSA